VAAIAEDAPERPLAAAMAKAAADDCQRKVCQEAIQTLGGIGFTWEHDAHLYVKRARSSAMLFGAAPEHRRSVAALLGVSDRAATRSSA
jgi:alkylation response protein AidB-like acyl-CoA dehydrogenase